MESPSDPERRLIDLPSGRAAYTDEGSGSAVLAIHGLPGSVRDFRWLAPHCARGLRFLRVDLPGFGDTPIETEPNLSPLGRARFVCTFARALGLDRPILLGHSMGGVVATKAVSLEPRSWSGLALISTPGLRVHRAFRRFPAHLMARLLARPRRARAFAPVLRALFRLGGFVGHSDEVQARTVFAAKAVSFLDHAACVREIALPTMVAWCDDDALIEVEIASELALACPAGPRLRFATGGHNPQKTHAREIAEALIRWRAELAGSGL